MIVVFGSINVDFIIPVPRLPRAGETVLGGDYALLPGGKGANQALAARRAGAEVVMAGAVGADPFAGLALDLLRGDGVDTRLVRVVGGPTGCAAIMVSSEGENTIAVAPGANASARSDQVPDELLCAGTTGSPDGGAPERNCDVDQTSADAWRIQPAQPGARSADRHCSIGRDRSCGCKRR